MRVAMLIADRQDELTGCGMYRCILPAAQAQKLGVEVAIADRLVGYADANDHVKSVPKVEADVLVYQRPVSRKLVETIPFVQAQGVRVVVELDDDVERVSPNNAAYLPMHPAYSPDSNWEWLRKACIMADRITVTTPALAERYGGHGRVDVLPNFVPESWLTSKRPPVEAVDGHLYDRVCIGWSGTAAVHPDDLQVTTGQVARVLDETGAKFRQVGDPQGVLTALGITHGIFEATGWLPIDQYPIALSTLDVGIVPLEDSAFNRAKSWLKGLEMAALGVPFVASPTPEYVRLNEMGIGLIARRPRDWYRHLTRLVTDEDYRREVADRGRAAVREHGLTIEGNGHRWVSAWEAATKRLVVVGGVNATPLPA